MGTSDSERGQMAASLRWDTDAYAESHGNRNGYGNSYADSNRDGDGFGNTHGQSDSNFNSDCDDNSNCQSHCNAHSDTDGNSYGDCNADVNTRCLRSRTGLLEKPWAMAGKSIAAWQPDV
jgi:hypothetical protein